MNGFSDRKLSRCGCVAALVVVAAGCSLKPATVWTPAPRVLWGDIAIQPVPMPAKGYVVSDRHPTRGLFPASLAVTRVAVAEDETHMLGARPILFADPRSEFLQWNLAVNDQMAVSEVFPIGPSSVGGGPVDPAGVLATFRALHARLGLVYAVNELSEDETEILGVLYDVEAAEPIAAIHARATSVVPEPELEQE
ncbi:MAG: hypothetical protein IID49_15170, partial [Proteobacteria bacterium]|nr:hypothetical protein [Pseudomonadota bacterium]